MTLKSIYQLQQDRLHTVGELRNAEAALLADRQANRDMSSRSRVQDRKIIDWAKWRNEEWAPLRLLADGLVLDDAETFRWTPAGAADFVITSGNTTPNVQCTMACDAHTLPRTQDSPLTYRFNHERGKSGAATLPEARG